MCNLVLDPVGCTVQSIASAVPNAAQAFATSVIKATVGWWVDVPSLSPASLGLGTATGPGSTVRWISVVVLLVGVMVSCIRLMLNRADAFVSIGRGIVTWMVTAATAVIVISALMAMVDALSRALLGGAISSLAASRLVAIISSPFLPLGFKALFASLAGISSLVIAIMMLARDMAIAVLTVWLIVTAAASAGGGPGPYLRIIRWLAALILFKLAVAAIYAAGFALAATKDARSAIAGIVLIVSAALCLPLLLRLVGSATDIVQAHLEGGANVSVDARVDAEMRRVEREQHTQGVPAIERQREVERSWSSAAPPPTLPAYAEKVPRETTPSTSPPPDFIGPGMLISPRKES